MESAQATCRLPFGHASTRSCPQSVGPVWVCLGPACVPQPEAKNWLHLWLDRPNCYSKGTFSPCQPPLLVVSTSWSWSWLNASPTLTYASAGLLPEASCRGCSKSSPLQVSNPCRNPNPGPGSCRHRSPCPHAPTAQAQSHSPHPLHAPRAKEAGAGPSWVLAHRSIGALGHLAHRKVGTERPARCGPPRTSALGAHAVPSEG